MKRLCLVVTIASLIGGSALAQRRESRPPSLRAATLIERGRAYFAAGDRGSAIGFFREAIQADPRSAAGYIALGEAYRARGSMADSRIVFEAGIMRNPDHPPLWIGLAQTLIDGGAEEDAARALRTLLARVPDDPESLAMMADLARRLGTWSESLAATRALVAVGVGGGISPERLEEQRRIESALRLLSAPVDPVSSDRSCAESASPIRAALARCARQ